MKEFVRVHRLLRDYKDLATYDVDFTYFKDDELDEKTLDTIVMDFKRVGRMLSMFKDLTIVDMFEDTISVIGERSFGVCQCDITVRCY